MPRLQQITAASCMLGAVVMLAFACTPATPAVAIPDITARPSAAPPATAAALPPPGSTSATPTVTPPTAAPTPPRFAVVSENAQVSQAALAIMEAGGSATDAVIAAMLVAGVVHPVSSGIGGGGFAMHFDASSSKVSAVDFRESAPIGLRPGRHAQRPPPPKLSGIMVGVPGEVAGIAEMHRRWGKLALGDLFRPAIQHAEKGYPISHHMRRSLAWSHDWATRSARPSAVFAPLGNLLTFGERAKNAALGATLRKIASEGPDVVYNGSIGLDIVGTARTAGSRILMADLNGYQVLERTPIEIAWEGKRVFTMPPPSAGGLMLAETLNMHSKADLVQLGYGSGAYVHVLAETMRGANSDRVHEVGDPAFINTDIPALISPKRMKARRGRISLDSTQLADSFRGREKGTHSIVVVDGDNNVAAVTSSVRSMFGSQLMTEGGFILNDALSDFEQPRIERRYRAQRRPNATRGGARPVSSMAPTIVLDEADSPVLALGGSGGSHIAGSITQAVLARLAFDHTVDAVVRDPRIHVPPSGGLYLEPGTSDALVADLRKRGEVVIVGRPNFSALGVVAISRRNGARWLTAVGDPRKGGVGLVR